VSAPGDKYAELTERCAGQAAEALALMLGASAASPAKRAWTLADGRLPRELFAAGERVTAVLAQLEGRADGLAGLILRRDLLEWILRRLIGDGDVATLSERALSALCEVGNIAVSAAANALSAAAGGAVLPSIPRLGFEKEAVSVLAEVGGDLAGRNAHLVEVELLTDEGPRELLFLWVPEA
jgi:chemotaxis protein CheY-P-specific phosphatase CheC